jgi:hypothetical protein
MPSRLKHESPQPSVGAGDVPLDDATRAAIRVLALDWNPRPTSRAEYANWLAREYVRWEELGRPDNKAHCGRLIYLMAKQFRGCSTTHQRQRWHRDMRTLLRPVSAATSAPASGVSIRRRDVSARLRVEAVGLHGARPAEVAVATTQTRYSLS